jgi:hypothetical protein
MGGSTFLFPQFLIAWGYLAIKHEIFLSSEMWVYTTRILSNSTIVISHSAGVSSFRSHTRGKTWEIIRKRSSSSSDKEICDVSLIDYVFCFCFFFLLAGLRTPVETADVPKQHDCCGLLRAQWGLLLGLCEEHH